MAEENQINLPFKNNENSNENNIESNQINQEGMSKENLIKRKKIICSFLLIVLFILEILFIILGLVNLDDDDKDKKKESTDDEGIEQDERLTLGGLGYIFFFGCSIIFSLIIIICTCINCLPYCKIIFFICFLVLKGIFSGVSLDYYPEVRKYIIGFIIVNVIFFIIAIGFQIYIIKINKNP